MTLPPSPPVRSMPNLVASCTSSRRSDDAAADQDLVVTSPVDVGGVEERQAEVEHAVDRGDRLVPVGLAVRVAHPHAAQALGRDREFPQ